MSEKFRGLEENLMKDTIGPDEAEDHVDETPDFDPEVGTLMGDMRDAMLQRIRTLQKPWAQLTEAEQTDCANGVELAARDMIRKTVRLVNKHEWPHAVVKLCEIKIGGTNGIDIKMTCPNIAVNREVLGDHVNTEVMVVMADSETFMAAKAPAQIDKDQPSLDLEGDDSDRRPADEDID